jgi:hypothetical protein
VELLQRNSEARKKTEAGISELAGRDVRFLALERNFQLLFGHKSS